MNSSLGVNVALATGSGLGLITNSLSFYYVKTTYDLSNSLYFNLAFDAILVSLVSLSMIPLYIYLAIVGKTDWVSCSAQLLGFPMLPNVLPALGFCISLIRYKRMTANSRNGWLGDTTEKCLTVVLILIFMGYYLGLVSYNTFVNEEMFHVYIVCMDGEHATQDLMKSLPALVLCSPVILFAASTLVMDARCLWFIRKHQTGANGKKRHGVDTIPLRATLISIACLVPATISCPILGILYYVSDDLEVKFYTTFVICNVVAIVRNPIIAAFTFRANEKNKKKDKKAELEKRRLKVLEAAEGAKMKRQRQMQSSEAQSSSDVNPSSRGYIRQLSGSNGGNSSNTPRHVCVRAEISISSETQPSSSNSRSSNTTSSTVSGSIDSSSAGITTRATICLSASSITHAIVLFNPDPLVTDV